MIIGMPDKQSLFTFTQVVQRGFSRLLLIGEDAQDIVFYLKGPAQIHASRMQPFDIRKTGPREDGPAREAGSERIMGGLEVVDLINVVFTRILYVFELQHKLLEWWGD